MMKRVRSQGDFFKNENPLYLMMKYIPKYLYLGISRIGVKIRLNKMSQINKTLSFKFLVIFKSLINYKHYI